MIKTKPIHLRYFLMGSAGLAFCLGGLFVFRSLQKTADLSDEMVWLPSAEFLMGSDRGMPDEAPAHPVALDGYWIDQYEVTNAEYQTFVAATGYLTVAERNGDGMVFDNAHMASTTPLPWWRLEKGVAWDRPQGATAKPTDFDQHPVVQVAFEDAQAYCHWQNKELPTEAQFEYAARGGREGQIYSWGNQPVQNTNPVSNTWQGTFPIDNQALDGYLTTAPVGSFPANDFKLYDITGNVWEWVSDWYHPRYYEFGPTTNPTGVTQDQSIDPAEPAIPKRIIRGGSFLCADNYCAGFRVSARMPADPHTSTNHTGFRCAANSSWLDRLVMEW